MIQAGRFDRRIVIEKQSTTQDANYGTPLVVWETLVTVWANWQDVMPSRSESVKMGLDVARNQTRVRIRYITGVDSSMRIILLGPPDVTYQIVGGPAEIGKRKTELEFMVERYSS